MRRLHILLSTLIALTVTTSCGGGPTADRAVRDAIAATRHARTAAVALEVRASIVTVRASGTVDFANERSAMRSTGLGRSVEERFVDGTLYVHGTGWPKWLATTSRADDLKTPTDALELLGGGTGAQRFGREAVDGVRTTHYKLRVTVGEEQVTADLWIDDQHRIRRVRAPLPAPEAGLHATATLTFARFGLRTTITAPPASEVTTSTSDTTATDG
jgi:hypothetical protein